jgi:putative serine protease PepD
MQIPGPRRIRSLFPSSKQPSARDDHASPRPGGEQPTAEAGGWSADPAAAAADRNDWQHTRPLPEGASQQAPEQAHEQAPPPYQQPFGGFGRATPAAHSGHEETPAGPPAAEQPSPPASRGSGRPRGGAVAAILVGALVLGGAGGIAGAAGFRLADPGTSSDTSSSSTPVRTSSVVAQPHSAPSADSVEAVAKAVLPSVVKINVSGAQGQGSGSGIVIGSQGEILTNNHVVALAGSNGSISVNFNDGSARRAHVVGTDPVTDLAVIKADGVSGLRPATIGSSTRVAVGENVVAIGSPFGLEATVTSGIVSALNRPVSVASPQTQNPGDPFGLLPQQSSVDTTYPAIQTDAAINPGNSGGPLVDLNGDVIGINSSIRTASSGLDSAEGGSIGLGFAIPISNVWPIVQQLRHGEPPTHAKMGVSVTDVSSNNGLLTGAGIRSVNPGSAAQRAGLKRGDVITKVDADTISGSESLVATIRGHRPGDTVTLTVVSGGNHTHTVRVTLGSDRSAPTT